MATACCCARPVAWPPPGGEALVSACQGRLAQVNEADAMVHALPGRSEWSLAGEPPSPSPGCTSSRTCRIFSRDHPGLGSRDPAGRWQRRSHLSPASCRCCGSGSRQFGAGGPPPPRCEDAGAGHQPTSRPGACQATPGLQDHALVLLQSQARHGAAVAVLPRRRTGCGARAGTADGLGRRGCGPLCWRGSGSGIASSRCSPQTCRGRRWWWRCRWPNCRHWSSLDPAAGRSRTQRKARLLTFVAGLPGVKQGPRHAGVE